MFRGLALVLLGMGCLFLSHRVYIRKSTDDVSMEKTLSTVDEVMDDLAASYFPLEATGITKQNFDKLAAFAGNQNTGRGVTMIVQVIDGKIWVDRTYWKGRYAWDVLRAQFILEQLRLLLRTDEGRALGNFEFVLNTHDCPMRGFDGQGLIFSITSCNGNWALPMPQWFPWRDGAFGGWNTTMLKAHNKAWEVPWKGKSEKAVFYGAIRKSSLVKDEHERLTWINLDRHSWHQFGRGKLWKLQQDHPDLFEVGICKAGSVDQLEEVLQAMNWERKPYLSMDEQARQYRHVIYLEGTCGWADRLKNLLAYGMVIFLQDTPCHEFFQPLMKPWVHYIPVQNDLSDLVDRVRWAREHETEARLIGQRAAEFAQDFLTTSAWQFYIKHLLRHYSSLIKYEPKRRPAAKRFKGAVLCENRGDSMCDVEESFVPK